MQLIIKINLLYLIFTLISFSVFSQKVVINSESDYSVMNLTIEKYFKDKKIIDSIFFSSEIVENNSTKKIIKRELERRLKRDTIFMKIIADTYLYNNFIKDQPRWKKENRYKKYSKYLDIVFSKEEIENYKEQIIKNYYLWNEQNIILNDRVFIEYQFRLSQEELYSLDAELRSEEIEKLINYDSSPNKPLFTFSKPIYSKNCKYALIAYNYGGNTILNIFEKLKGDWVFKLSISENYFL